MKIASYRNGEKMHKYKLIDLFAGAGGLSLGFENTGRFETKVAVEKNPYAQDTYKENFPDVDYCDDINDIDFSGYNEKYGGIDVVIGGPPCQGFSNANRQHNQAINLNNKLVKQYIRAILQIQPKAFVMENVSMLKSEVHRFYIEHNDTETIKHYRIKTKFSSIYLLPEEYVFEGVPELVSSQESIISNQWEPDLYRILNIFLKDSANEEKLKSTITRHMPALLTALKKHQEAEVLEIFEADNQLFAFIKAGCAERDQVRLKQLLVAPLAFQKMLKRALEIHQNDIEATFTTLRPDGVGHGSLRASVRSCAVYDYLTGILGSKENGYSINNGILDAVDFGIPQKRRRFVIIGVKEKYTDKVELPKAPKDAIATNVFDAIADLEDLIPRITVEKKGAFGMLIGKKARETVIKLKQLRNTDGVVYNHVIPKTGEKALARFRLLGQGQNFHDLPDALKKNTYTNADRTQNTVYQRLSYSVPSGTVINVRKSMWIHPTVDRAISIREAARLQTFPDSFRFWGPKDSQYQQVGNAVPPMLAEAIARQILSYIDKRDNGR